MEISKRRTYIIGLGAALLGLLVSSSDSSAVGAEEYAKSKLWAKLWVIAVGEPLDEAALIIGSLEAQTAYAQCLLKVTSLDTDATESDNDHDSDSGSDSDSDIGDSPQDCEASLDADMRRTLQRAGVTLPVDGDLSAEVSACKETMPLEDWPRFLEMYVLRETYAEPPGPAAEIISSFLTDAMVALGAGEACFALFDRAFSEGCCDCSPWECCICQDGPRSLRFTVPFLP